MRKALATIGTGAHKQLLERTLPTFRSYAARHEYDVVVGNGHAETDRNSAWAKVPLLRDLLRRYEVVFWVDADAIILDGTRDVADELDPETFQGFVFHPSGPNTGVWLLRAGDRSQRFLEAVWNADLRDDHLGWWENSAVLKTLGYGLEWPPKKERQTEWDAYTVALERSWNVITIWDDGWRQARIHHLAGERPLVRRMSLESDARYLAGQRFRPTVYRIPWRCARIWRRSPRLRRVGKRLARS